MKVDSKEESFSVAKTKTKKKNSKTKKQASVIQYNENTEIGKIISQASVIIQNRLNVDRVKSDRIATLVIFASKEYNLDPRTMLAIIKVESDFNQSAHNKVSCSYKRETNKSRCGDHSVAQINYHVWKNEFIKNGRKPLDYNRLKTDDAYAVFRMAEILDILKENYGGKEKDWYARYHSSTPKLKNKYRKKVDLEFSKISEINPNHLFQSISSL